MGTHRKGTADRLERPGRAHRDDGHFAGVLLDELKPRFDRVLVAGVEDQLDALAHEALRLGVQFAGHVGIGDLLHADEDIHGWLHSLWINSVSSNKCLYYD